MPARSPVGLGGALGACLLGGCLLWMASLNPPALPRPVSPIRVAPPVARRTASNSGLREAGRLRMLAREAGKRELEAWEAADPEGIDGAAAESLRRGIMARDRSGYLRRARVAARQAAAMAETPSEAYLVAELLVLIECDLGHHREELRQASKLIALRPRDPSALMVLRRAAICNGDEQSRRRHSLGEPRLAAGSPPPLRSAIWRR